MTSGLDQQFGTFFERLRDAGLGLAAELEQCWRDAAAISAEQRRLSESVRTPETSGSLSAYGEAREELARRLLREVLGQLDRKRPVPRALEAMQSYDRALEEILTAIPETVLTSGSALLEALPRPEVRRLPRIGKWRRKARPVRLREMAAVELRRLTRERTTIEARLLAVLVDQTRLVVERWSTAIGRMDASVGAVAWEEPVAKPDLGPARAELALEALRGLPEKSAQRVTAGLRSAAAWMAPRRIWR